MPVDCYRQVVDPNGKQIILTKSCFHGHIAKRHPDVVMWVESLLDVIRTPEKIYIDRRKTFQYIAKIPKDIAQYFHEDARYFQVPVKSMKKDNKEFWGIATFFEVTEEDYRMRTKQWDECK
jgi:hypothetical protein